MKKTTGGHKSDGGDGAQRSRDLGVFSRAVTLFNSGKFAEAKQLFDQLAGVPDASLAHAARSRALICERRNRPS
jgi:hypothetical protein